eukprot:s286_g4.t1
MPPDSLGLGIMGLLPANRKLSFRSINEDQRRQSVGMAPHASPSSITKLLQRPAAAPGGTGTGRPDQIWKAQATPGLSHGHEGPSEVGKPTPKRSATYDKAPKRRKTVAELLGKTSSSASTIRGSFGKLERVSFGPGEAFPPSPPEERDGGVGPSPWAPLEFEAGGLPDHPGGQQSRGLSTVLQFANDTASKAKEKISSLVGMWSPKRKKPVEPLFNDRLPILAENIQSKGKRRKSINILAIARRTRSKDTTADLERDFASNTSRKAKAAIRTTIHSVFKESKGTSPLPPSPEKVKLLGGILKAAKYKAANNYLGEYKLMAIERGFEWTPQLERTLKLTKRSAARASGPKTKAAEVQVNERGEVFAERDPMISPAKSRWRESSSILESFGCLGRSSSRR